MNAYKLNNGVEIPVLGFGTWKLADGDECYEAVTTALKAGYRHIDTAQYYGNEASVGRAIRDSGLDREEIFVTTKVWNNIGTKEEALHSIQESLDKLGLNYVDLLLIHWPNPVAFRQEPGYEKRNLDLWAAFKKTYQEDRARALGVSNFEEHHLKALLPHVEILPTVNQIKLAPGLPQAELVQFCRQEDLQLEGYSPLGSGKIFEDETLLELAEKYGHTVAQIALRWSLQHGYIPLPRSKTPANIESNLDVFDFTLEKADMAKLDDLSYLVDKADPDHNDI